MRAPADRQLDGRVDGLEDLRRLGGEAAVLLGGLRADLPGAVHLIPEAPVFDAEGLLEAVGAAAVAELGATGKVAVFDEVARLGDAARAEIDGEHALRSGAARPFLKFVYADLVGLYRAPCEIEPPRAQLTRAGPVLPVVAGDEVAARIAHDVDAELLYHAEHVAAKAHIVRGRVSRLVDAAVDGPAEVLDERAEKPPVYLADRVAPVGKKLRFQASASLHRPFGADGFSHINNKTRAARCQ